VSPTWPTWPGSASTLPPDNRHMSAMSTAATAAAQPGDALNQRRPGALLSCLEWGWLEHGGVSQMVRVGTGDGRDQVRAWRGGLAGEVTRSTLVTSWLRCVVESSVYAMRSVFTSSCQTESETGAETDVDAA
jgi:hypothetical protein